MAKADDSIRVRFCRHRCDEGVHRKCALGIDVEALITEQVGPEKFGRHYMSPCHDSTSTGTRKATCKSYSPLTAEEQKAEDEEDEKFIDQLITRMQLLQPLIQTIKDRVATLKSPEMGMEDCPICAGTLTWRCSEYNLHINMRCTTEGCVNFIE